MLSDNSPSTLVYSDGPAGTYSSLTDHKIDFNHAHWRQNNAL